MAKKSSKVAGKSSTAKSDWKISRNSKTGEFLPATKSDRYIKETAEMYGRVLTRLAKK